MFVDDDYNHYFWVGESALNVILAALSLAQRPMPRKIHDFGAGAGRVTRWLVGAFPKAEIHAWDVRDENMDFLRKTFGVEARTVSPDPDLLTITDRYDLIWVGSVITHLPEVEAQKLITKLFSQLESRGLLIMSFHGQTAIDLRDSGAMIYINDEAWQTIREGYFASGYGYADYPDMPGYGISVTRLSWVAEFIANIPSSRLLKIIERGWADHHDVVMIERPGFLAKVRSIVAKLTRPPVNGRVRGGG